MGDFLLYEAKANPAGVDICSCRVSAVFSAACLAVCLCEPGQNHTQGLFHFIHCNLCCCGAATVGVFQPVDIERAGTVGVEVGKRLGAARFLTDTCGLLEQLDLGVVLGPLAHDPVGVYLLSDQDDGGVLNNLLVELARCEALRVVASLDELVSYVFVDAVADEGAGSCAGEDPLVFQTVLGGKVLGDDLAGCAAGDVAGADEDSFEGAVAARAAGTVEGLGESLNSGVRSPRESVAGEDCTFPALWLLASSGSASSSASTVGALWWPTRMMLGPVVLPSTSRMSPGWPRCWCG